MGVKVTNIHLNRQIGKDFTTQNNYVYKRGERILITWGAWGELINNSLPAKEKSKGASGKKWHPAKAHLKGTAN